MGHLHDIRSRLVEGPGSIGQKRRAGRWELLASTFPKIGTMHVIDLGGTPRSWMRAPIHPATVHVVNLDGRETEESLPDWITFEQGDACVLPKHLLDRRFDLVYSNSVIEHVGGHAQRRRFAESVHTLGERYWVQTPYRYFPIEPHWLFPGFQFLPVKAQATISQQWPLMHTRSSSAEAAVRAALQVELLSQTEMRHYFPDCRIVKERMAGLTKSIIAVRVITE